MERPSRTGAAWHYWIPRTSHRTTGRCGSYNVSVVPLPAVMMRRLFADEDVRCMSTPPRAAKELASLLDALAAHIGEVFLGKPEVVRLALVALLSDGHL